MDSLSPLSATLRFALEDDVEFIASLGERAFRRYSGSPDSNMRRMLSNPSGVAIVAESPGVAPNGKVVRLGFAIVNVKTLEHSFGPWTRPGSAYLDAIAVRPKMVNRGIGRRLLEHAQVIARARGAVSMSLLTAHANHRARHLFESSGFQILMPVEDAYVGRQSAVWMWKSL